MSIKKRIYLSVLFSVSLTFIISFISLYFIYSRLMESRIKETYEIIYKNYKELINHEKENLKFLDDKTIPQGDYYYKRKLHDRFCNEEAYYRILPIGAYYGINRFYPTGCYFVGIKLEELLKIMKSLADVDWIVYYNRSLLKDVLDGPIDSFMKEKVVIDDMVIDKFSDPKALYMPLDVKGYMLYGSFLEKRLLIEVPLTGMNGLPIGQIVFIKDVSSIYRETYLIFLALALHSLLVFSFLAFMLFRIASNLVGRVIFLKNIAASIEKRDFSAADLLKDSKESEKDEVWELRHSIYNMAVSLKQAFEELKEKQRELEELAYYDPLTGLPNRRFFFEHANLILESAKRYKNHFALLLMDLDHFKKINDVYGHEAGDLLLKRFADVLRKNSRKSDVPARLGGEEFVLLMPNTNVQQGKVVAERIRQQFQNSVVVHRGVEISTTLSGGLASFVPGVEEIDDLIRMADEALYKAKELGRNRIEVYEPKI